MTKEQMRNEDLDRISISSFTPEFTALENVSMSLQIFYIQK